MYRRRKGKKVTHKTKDRVTRTPLKTGGEHVFFHGLANVYRQTTLVTNHDML